ncbi:hypothetical protein MA16_Dca010208 [Dendrobium catenatum]|uniref:Uncharacterized protein n=1 Tax=Dendrobium catenatum TaxID=906689 RepID=A0A2I0WAE8_9ASPA|nr:hypothetical protein MA16_Dca010208 [Dendrobium catenatum]
MHTAIQFYDVQDRIENDLPNKVVIGSSRTSKLPLTDSQNSPLGTPSGPKKSLVRSHCHNPRPRCFICFQFQ